MVLLMFTFVTPSYAASHHKRHKQKKHHASAKKKARKHQKTSSISKKSDFVTSVEANSMDDSENPSMGIDLGADET